MNDANYNVQKDPWYSPIEVIKRFEQLRSRYGDVLQSHPDFKKARELFAGAVSLLGAYELHSENIYFLQLNTQSTTPDVVAAKQTEQGNEGVLLEISLLEITEFEDHFKSEDIVEFLKSTKFSNKKSYGDKTFIICMVNRITPLNHLEIARKLKEINSRYTLYLIGRPYGGVVGEFVIISILPLISKPVRYNVNETAEKYKIPSRVTFSLGAAKKIKYEGPEPVPFNIFEMFGLDGNKINKKYDIRKINLTS